MVRSLRSRMLLAAYLGLLAVTVECGALFAWVFTPFPSPVNLDEDPPFTGPIDVLLCAVGVASFVLLLLLHLRGGRAKSASSDATRSWAGRWRDLCFVSGVLVMARVCGHELALDGPIVYHGVRYPPVGTTSPWIWVACIIVCLLLALVVASLALVDGLRTSAAA